MVSATQTTSMLHIWVDHYPHIVLQIHPCKIIEKTHFIIILQMLCLSRDPLDNVNNMAAHMEQGRTNLNILQ
jgi:hypothetical protein